MGGVLGGAPRPARERYAAARRRGLSSSTRSQEEQTLRSTSNGMPAR